MLYQLNQARKGIEKKIFDQIVYRVENNEIDISRNAVIIATGKEWQPGVIGLVASKVSACYVRPTILLHVSADGILKGSCRSIPEFNIFGALSKCSDLLKTFGGHAMAAGLSMDAKNLPEFQLRMNAFFNTQLPDFDFKNKLVLDAQLELYDVNKKLLNDLSYLEPFGCENSQPIFIIKNISILEKPIILKDVHVKCTIFADGVIKPVIFFYRPDLYDYLCSKMDSSITIAVHVIQNNWNGKVSIELQGVDVL